MPGLLPRLANHCADSPPATPRCPACRSRPAPYLRPSPAAAACKRAVRSCAVPRRQIMPSLRAQFTNRSPHSPPATPSLSGRPLSPHVFSVTGHCAFTVRHATYRCSQLALVRWLANTRLSLLHRAVVSEDARLVGSSRQLFSRFFAGNASLAGRPLSPHVFCASVPHGGCLQRCGAFLRRAAACKDARVGAKFTIRFPDSPPATPRCPAGRSCPTFSFAPFARSVAGRYA